MKMEIIPETLPAASVTMPSISATEINRPQKPKKKNMNAGTKMMAMVLCVYLFIYLLNTSPRLIFGLVSMNENAAQCTSFIMLIMERLTTLVWWCQSFLNPVIYAWQSKEFKRAFRKLLRMKTNQLQPMMP